MIKKSDVTVIVVTKGDRDISRVRESLNGFACVCVWDNAALVAQGREDAKVYGRYAAMGGPGFDYQNWCQWFLCRPIATQDDDVIVDWDPILAAYDETKLVCNMPQPWREVYTKARLSLVGFGAIANQQLWEDRWQSRYLHDRIGFTAAEEPQRHWPLDDLFLNECDRVFTGLHWDQTVWVEAEIERLKYAFGVDRMYQRPDNHQHWIEIQRRINVIRDGPK